MADTFLSKLLAVRQIGNNISTTDEGRKRKWKSEREWGKKDKGRESEDSGKDLGTFNLLILIGEVCEERPDICSYN